MNSKLNIPKKIKIGFQKRSDTYTGMLAYVIYFDAKGILHKETSWEGWRDKKIDPVEYENEPTSGFVLNKGVGGARESYGWNARNEYIRVYDPRGFEFEISVANLLFILQECSAIKGKGLEGDFIYAWDGKDLVLLPVSSQEYQKSLDFGDLQVKKVKASEFVPGRAFLTKKQQKVMYLGRYAWYDKLNRWHSKKSLEGQKVHVFVLIDKMGKSCEYNFYGRDSRYLLQTGFTGIASVLNEDILPQFAEEFEYLNKSSYVSPISKLLIKKLEEIPGKDSQSYSPPLLVKVIEDKIFLGELWNAKNYWYPYSNMEKLYFKICYKVFIKDGKFIQEKVERFEKEEMSEEALMSVTGKLYIECENGSGYFLQ